MKARGLVLAGIGLAAVLAGTAAVLDQMAAAGPPAPLAGSTIPGPAAAPATSAAAPTAPAGDIVAGTAPGPGTDAAADGGAGKAPGTSTDSPLPLPVGREVLPPVSASPTGLPKPSPLAALVREPLPEAASTRGKIVNGFPADILPFPTGTTIVSTGVSSAEGTLQVTADALVPLSQDSVVGHFQQILGPLEFWSEPAQAREGQRAVQFNRGDDSLTLATSTTGTGNTRFMLLGTLHAVPSR